MDENILSVYTDTLDKADALYAAKDFRGAGDLYFFVAQGLDKLLKQDDLHAGIGGALVGGILGFIIPFAHLITVPLCTWAGYKLAKDHAGNSYTNSPYGAAYNRALKGMMSCVESTEKK